MQLYNRVLSYSLISAHGVLEFYFTRYSGVLFARPIINISGYLELNKRTADQRTV